MSVPNLLQLARQGDPEAIAVLMTQALASRGITAQAKLRAGLPRGRSHEPRHT